ncbi:MAG: hypothetical protein A4E53_01498 [Pelotomaculum sp. PtaB.Bin104]|nr:MAG: hypothetical protein A4E53_01498 [Pelotomaculum sp. PtaB.Bin104]
MRPIGIRIEYVKAKVGELRNTLGLKKIPISVEDVIKSYGIKLRYVFDIQFPTLVRYNERYAIFIPPSINMQRERWSCAHEFAHFYLKHYETFPVSRFINGHYIDLLSEKEIYILERECDIFVAEWLLPKEQFLEMVKFPVTLDQAQNLKKIFNVSLDSVINRLIELGVIKNRKELIIEEPHLKAVNRELSDRLLRSVLGIRKV